jgi:dihydroflavonol-4-reductase
LLAGLDLEHATGDINHFETLDIAMHGVDVVFHAAAKVGGPGTEKVQSTIINGTHNVLRAARHNGVERLVYTSSMASLGVPNERYVDAILMDEHHTWNLPAKSWIYGHSKYLAELEVGHAVAQGLDVVVVNPTVVVGAGDLNRVSGEAIVRVARGQVPVAIPGGINVAHIDDVVQGHLAALEHGRTGERYIIGGENMPFQKFLTILSEVVGKRPPRLVLPKGLLRPLARPVASLTEKLSLPVDGGLLHFVGYFFYYDTQKAELELGFTPRRTTQSAVEETYNWYVMHGVL